MIASGGMVWLARLGGDRTDFPAVLGEVSSPVRPANFGDAAFDQAVADLQQTLGILTGKGSSYGGSLLRPEATGYGVVIFLEQMVLHNRESLKGKVCVVSGSGNVAQYCALKLLECEAKVVSLSDSDGYIFEPDGFTRDQIECIMQLKNERRERIKEYCSLSSKAKYVKDAKPWGLKCDVACPCATQNEIQLEDAVKLVENGCRYVVEGANMPSTIEAIHYYVDKKVWYGPAKAANAGGVAVSGLEMSQNSMRIKWSREEVYQKLEDIMKSIFEDCKNSAIEYKQTTEDGYINLNAGANISAFLKVAEATIQQGCI